MNFIYTVWFRNLDADVDGQDDARPACIRIIADSATAAQAWAISSRDDDPESSRRLHF